MTAAGHALTWSDVVAWMRAAGGWAGVEAAAAAGRALERAQLSEPTSGGRRAEARRFRYERGLLTGEELDAWLTWWALTGDQWGEWIDRSLRRSNQSVEGPAAPAPEQDVWAEAVCSGALELAASELAEAAAAWVELRSGAPLPGLSAEGAAALRAAATDLGNLPVAPSDLETTVSRRALPWTSVDLEWIVFEQPDAAREACACCRFDGLGLGAVAALSGAAAKRCTALVEDLVPELQPVASSAPVGVAVLAGAPDQPVGVALVHHRQAASIDAPLARARALRVCRRERVASAVSRHVRWEQGVRGAR